MIKFYALAVLHDHEKEKGPRLAPALKLPPEISEKNVNTPVETLSCARPKTFAPFDEITGKLIAVRPAAGPGRYLSAMADVVNTVGATVVPWTPLNVAITAFPTRQNNTSIVVVGLCPVIFNTKLSN